MKLPRSLFILVYFIFVIFLIYKLQNQPGIVSNNRFPYDAINKFDEDRAEKLMVTAITVFAGLIYVICRGAKRNSELSEKSKERLAQLEDITLMVIMPAMIFCVIFVFGFY